MASTSAVSVIKIYSIRYQVMNRWEELHDAVSEYWNKDKLRALDCINQIHTFDQTVTLLEFQND